MHFYIRKELFLLCFLILKVNRELIKEIFDAHVLAEPEAIGIKVKFDARTSQVFS